MIAARPLWLEFPEDPEAAKQEQEWMLGSDVLVAPVVHEGATGRRIYFPAGCWKHGETGRTYAGTRYADVPAELDDLPWFERCGTNPIP